MQLALRWILSTKQRREIWGPFWKPDTCKATNGDSEKAIRFQQMTVHRWSTKYDVLHVDISNLKEWSIKKHLTHFLNWSLSVCFLQLPPMENIGLCEMDVKTTFLNVDLMKHIFMDQPKGFVDYDFSDYVFKLLKVLLGLLQAPRFWSSKINPFWTIQSLELVPIFHAFMSKDRFSGNNDIIICGWFTNSRTRHHSSQFYAEYHWWKIWDGRLWVGQVMQSFGMGECKAVGTPIRRTKWKLRLYMTPWWTKHFTAKQIGSIVYLKVFTRYDTCF